MSNVIILDREEVYKEIQNQIKAYNGPVEFGVVMADGFINVYNDRGHGMPINIGTAYITWEESFKEQTDQSSAGYAKYVFDVLLNRALRHGQKINLPSRKKIIKSKQMVNLRTRFPNLDDNLIAKYIIYLYVTKQTCKHCEIGEIEVEVGSYSEYHRCLNCGRCETIS